MLFVVAAFTNSSVRKSQFAKSSLYPLKMASSSPVQQDYTHVPEDKDCDSDGDCEACALYQGVPRQRPHGKEGDEE